MANSANAVTAGAIPGIESNTLIVAAGIGLGLCTGSGTRANKNAYWWGHAPKQEVGYERGIVLLLQFSDKKDYGKA